MPATASDERVDAAFDETLAAEWDALLARSDANTVFLTSPWLRAWHETLGRDRPFAIAQIRREGRLVAAATFHDSDGTLRFGGSGPSDYSDFVVDASLDCTERAALTARLVTLARDALPNGSHFELGRIRPDSATCAALERSALFASVIARVEAPYMDMRSVDDRVRKKSLNRHARGLAREGRVDVATYLDGDDVVPQLDGFFFDQHARRWQSVGGTSLFAAERNRAFYRAVARHCGRAGTLRYTTIRLDDAPVAAHFGFLHADAFIWYKPTFEPALARLSPGEVLILRLLERARDEGAREFDFTIGNEAFKHRFATGVREVKLLHVTASPLRALARRSRAFVGRHWRAIRRRA